MKFKTIAHLINFCVKHPKVAATLGTVFVLGIGSLVVPKNLFAQIPGASHTVSQNIGPTKAGFEFDTEGSKVTGKRIVLDIGSTDPKRKKGVFELKLDASPNVSQRDLLTMRAAQQIVNANNNILSLGFQASVIPQKGKEAGTRYGATFESGKFKTSLQAVKSDQLLLNQDFCPAKEAEITMHIATKKGEKPVY
ncbi:MAG: hypothetical protein AB1467_01120 [Candidatus Diapherotrites archaeon]